MGIISGFMVQAKSLGPYVYYEYLKDHTIGVRGLVNLFFFGILQFTSLALAFLYFSEYKPDIPFSSKSDTLESELRDLSFENNQSSSFSRARYRLLQKNKHTEKISTLKKLLEEERHKRRGRYPTRKDLSESFEDESERFYRDS